MSLARDLARYLGPKTAADLSPQSLEYAGMLVASTLASAAYGVDIESSAITMSLAMAQGGEEESSIWFHGSRLPVAPAARVNATMSDSAASDDSDLRNIVHPGTPLVATTLALGEKLGSSGEEVLTAIVLGYEAQARMGSALTPGFRDLGFHGCIIAVFGSAVASARLLNADEDQMTHAIALAATSIGGLMAAANTSWSREYHAGLATFLGNEAAFAAYANFRGEEQIIEMPKGFIDLHGGGDPALALEGLGSGWMIEREIAIKLMPGAHQYHASAEAAAEAARKGNVTPDEIDQIIVSRSGVRALSGPRRPANLIDMAHSAAYFVAAGAADRDFTWEHASPEKITDPVIAALCDRVIAGPEPAEPLDPNRQGATVTIRTKDGRSYTSTVKAPKGSADRGVGWPEVEAKFRALMPASELFSTERIERALQAIRDLRAAPDLRPLAALITYN